jgi:hypothetical protein
MMPLAALDRPLRMAPSDVCGLNFDRPPANARHNNLSSTKMHMSSDTHMIHRQITMFTGVVECFAVAIAMKYKRLSPHVRLVDFWARALGKNPKITQSRSPPSVVGFHICVEASFSQTRPRAGPRDTAMGSITNGRTRKPEGEPGSRRWRRPWELGPKRRIERLARRQRPSQR